MSELTRIGEELPDWAARVKRAAAKQAPHLRAVDVDEPVDPVKVRAGLWAVKVGLRLAGATVDTLDGDLARWVREWLDDDESPDLFLHGPVGCGKTWAATAAARHEHMNGHNRVEWWTVPSLLEELRPDGDRPLAAVQTADVLVLDDLGRDKPTDWTLEQLHLILDYRHRHRMPTIVTSNWSPDDLPGRVGRQVASRLLGAETVGGVPSDGADRRMS